MPLPNKAYLLGAVAGVGVAGAAAAGIGLALPAAHAQDARVVRAATAPIFAAPPGGPVSFADIFERVAPAVVSIEVTARVPRSELGDAQALPFPFNQLPQFRQGPPNGRGAPGQRGGPRRGGAPNGAPNGDNDGDGAGGLAGGAGCGLRLLGLGGRLHRHQQPRGGETPPRSPSPSPTSASSPPA